ncbi:glycosyltransferase [candidate division KSB1 bacterium]
MEKSIELLSREVDEAMAKQDYQRLVEAAREILMYPVDKVGIDAFIRSSIVFAYGLLQIDQKDDAKNVLLSLEKSKMGLIDTFFLLFCIAFEEKNSDEIIGYGKKFVDLIPDPSDPPECITTGVQNAHEVINNLATHLLERERYEEAIDLLEKGKKFKKDFPLVYINLAIACHRSGKFEDAESVLFEALEDCEETGEIHRTLGLIYDERFLYLKAELQFRKAIEKGVFESYFDLGIMFHKLFKIYDAEEEIQNYLKHNPGESNATKLLYDIRALDFYGKKEERISAAMIVKNEENMLAECIESFREAVDEIVVVDTGSSDNTVKIAKEYNVELLHHEWKNDFSEARNFSISKTTGDIVLIIDADERLEREDIPRVRALKWQYEHDILCFGVYSALPGHLGSASFGKHYSPRLFRKSPDIYYYGIVHNILNIPDKAGMTNIRIYHLGYDLDQEKMKVKFERSITLLLKQVEEEPDNAFVLMNTAQMFLSRNLTDEAEKHSLRCVELLEEDPGDQIHLYLMGLYQLSLIYLRRRQYEKSEKYALRALEKNESYLDPILNLCWCYYLQKDYDGAIPYLERFLECREHQLKNEEFNLLIVSKLGSDYEVFYILGEIFRERGDFEKAKEHYLNSVKSNPLYWNVYNSLGKIYMKEGSYPEAVDAFENAIKYGYLNAEKYGTTGAPNEVYRGAIESYREAVEKDVRAQRSKPSIEDALGKIDGLLEDGAV